MIRNDTIYQALLALRRTLDYQVEGRILWESLTVQEYDEKKLKDFLREHINKYLGKKPWLKELIIYEFNLDGRTPPGNVRYRAKMFILEHSEGTPGVKISNYELKDKQALNIQKDDFERNVRDKVAELSNKLDKARINLPQAHKGSRQNPSSTEKMDIVTNGPYGRLAGVLPVHTDHFTGRRKELQDIHAYFSVEEHENRKVLLTGFGGTGKTMLATQYVWEYKSRYQWVIWLNLSSSVSATQCLRTILSQVGIPMPDENLDRLLAEYQNWIGN